MIKRKKKPPQEIEEKRQETQKMWDFFLEIWKERPHYSEVSKKWLGPEPLTIFFHHILKSRKYPQAKYDRECIILVTFEEHQKAEQNEEFYEEIKKRKEKLLIKYGKKREI